MGQYDEALAKLLIGSKSSFDQEQSRSMESAFVGSHFGNQAAQNLEQERLKKVLGTPKPKTLRKSQAKQEEATITEEELMAGVEKIKALAKGMQKRQTTARSPR